MKKSAQPNLTKSVLNMLLFCPSMQNGLFLNAVCATEGHLLLMLTNEFWAQITLAISIQHYYECLVCFFLQRCHTIPVSVTLLQQLVFGLKEKQFILKCKFTSLHLRSTSNTRDTLSASSRSAHSVYWSVRFHWSLASRGQTENSILTHQSVDQVGAFTAKLIDVFQWGGLEQEGDCRGLAPFHNFIFLYSEQVVRILCFKLVKKQRVVYCCGVIG